MARATFARQEEVARPSLRGSGKGLHQLRTSAFENYCPPGFQLFIDRLPYGLQVKECCWVIT